MTRPSDGPSQVSRVVDAIATARRTGPFTTVGIGGPGAAGKSTLARLIATEVDDAQIVSTDEFWNGSTFDLDRLRRSVLDLLLAGETVAYDGWDWAAKESRPGRVVRPSGVVIIEGVCALHQMFRDDLAVRVWVDTPAEVRLARGVARDGESSRSTWLDVWMPNEAAYIDRDDPVSCAQFVIDGSLPFT